MPQLRLLVAAFFILHRVVDDSPIRSDLRYGRIAFKFLIGCAGAVSDGSTLIANSPTQKRMLKKRDSLW